MKDKTCLITGGTSGVGKSIAIALAKQNAIVNILSRTVEKGIKTAEEIKKISNNPDVYYFICDQSDKNSIYKFIDEFKTKYSRLNLLANCAGALNWKRELTKDGIEKTFMVNYLSHFVITNELLDLLKQGKPARVISVGGTLDWVQKANLNVDDFNFEINYNPFKVAIHSILAKTVFTLELGKRLEGTGVTANVFHPGIIRLNLGRDLPFFLKYSQKIFNIFFSKESKTGIYLATSDDVEKLTGKYFVKKKPYEFKPKYVTENDTQKLLDLSKELLGHKSV